MTATPFAALAQRMTSAVYARLADVECNANGVTFAAMLDVDTTDFFDTARGVDFVLRYAAGPVLERGDTLTVAGSPLVPQGVDLVVSERPRPLSSGHECIAPLVRAV